MVGEITEAIHAGLRRCMYASRLSTRDGIGEILVCSSDAVELCSARKRRVRIGMQCSRLISEGGAHIVI